MILIPLNDNNTPATKFMTEELANEIIRSTIFIKKKKLIEKSQVYQEFIKKPLIEQKNLFNEFFSDELSEQLNKIIVFDYLKNTQKMKKSNKKKHYLYNRRSKLNNKMTNLVPLGRRSALVYGGGGENNSDYDYSLFVKIILALIVVFITICGVSFYNNMINLKNKSLAKNSERLIFYIITPNGKDNYFLKIAPIPEGLHLNKSNIKRNLNLETLSHNDLGSYVYECIMYDEMNKITNELYDSKDLCEYVSEIVDWNILMVNNQSEDFVVNIDTKKYNLDTYSTTYCYKKNPSAPNNLKSVVITEDNIKYNCYSTNLCDAIIKNFGQNYFSYSIVKAYENFDTFDNMLKNIRPEDPESYNNILNIYKNACNLLKSFYETKRFIHYDLHCGNLLVNKNTGEIKLFDFDLSEVQGSKSDIHENLYFLKTPEIQTLNLVKPNFGHLYDYYRLIVENMIYFPNLLTVLLRTFGLPLHHNPKQNIINIINQFIANGYLITGPETYSPQEIKDISKILKKKIKNFNSELANEQQKIANLTPEITAQLTNILLLENRFFKLNYESIYYFYNIQ